MKKSEDEELHLETSLMLKALIPLCQLERNLVLLLLQGLIQRETSTFPVSDVSSLSSPDFFDSPSPEDDKDDINHLSQRPIDSSKKAPRSLTSQVPENRAALPPKPGGLISSVSFSHGAPGAPSAFHIVTSSSHRSNSPSFGSSDARHTVEHGQSSLEELQAQVKELRSIIETMKDQQKKEIKQLLSELDEEKKIRLRLQMDVNEIKKSLQSK